MKPGHLSGLFILGLSLWGIHGCFQSPEKNTDSIPAVSGFEVKKYLGTWYEIARLPHRFEKNLEKVTAAYSLRPDGKMEVLNKGYDRKNEKWKQIRGKAWFKGLESQGWLKVSFFRFFSADYKIIELEKENYSFALVTSRSKKYLWILNRSPVMEEKLYNELVSKAKNLGFPTKNLIKVIQE